ncbi:hypothetical protein V1264_012336 [Littorina saxatilis]|uniref:DUF4817 domain-containing protein n=1 Tax=Littorina saxatilis TaxID=31220 RepID=A0AAN9GM44_9CAEN
MPWTKEQKVFCVTTYLETKSFKTVQAKYRRKFHINNYPQKSQIYRWVHKFKATGSVNNINKKAETPKSGRKLTVRSPDSVNAVRDSVGRSPKKSIRRRSQELGISRSSVQRILIKDLHLYPYRIQIKHKLITQNIRAIRKEECVKVIDNFARRLQVCLQRNGGHLEHVF